MRELHNRLNPQNLDHFFVLEGGGSFAIAYESGVLDEVRERGWDPKDEHMLGTSGGSWVGGMMLTDTHFDDVVGKEQIKLFNYREPDYMLGYARDVFGEKRAAGLNVTATELPWLRTRVLNCAEGDNGIAIADAVTRSSSVPGLFRPTHDRWVDGAVGGMSAGYAHYAPKTETLVCVAALSMHLKAPVPGPIKPAMGWALERKTRLELGKWQLRNPLGKVIYIRPNREISDMINDNGFGAIFDFKIAEEVYHMAREQMHDMIEGPDRVRRESIGKLVADLCCRIDTPTPEPLAA